MYVYCVYPAMSKSQKQHHDVLAYILLPFLTIPLHESGTRKAILWTANKLSSQCNLTAKIEPEQG